MSVPYFQVQHVDGGWSESMTTDVLVDQFDFGQHTEASLDKHLATFPDTQEFAFICEAYDHKWIMNIRRATPFAEASDV